MKAAKVIKMTLFTYSGSIYMACTVRRTHRITICVIVCRGWCQISKDDVVHVSRVDPTVAVSCSATHVLPGVSGGVTDGCTGKTA